VTIHVHDLTAAGQRSAHNTQGQQLHHRCWLGRCLLSRHMVYIHAHPLGSNQHPG
jgi:hypothetical protein